MTQSNLTAYVVGLDRKDTLFYWTGEAWSESTTDALRMTDADAHNAITRINAANRFVDEEDLITPQWRSCRGIWSKS